eukprot:COSAG05_NODE_1986_length_3740_cov_1527.682505_2_plen_50_part_00
MADTEAPPTAAETQPAVAPAAEGDAAAPATEAPGALITSSSLSIWLSPL